MDPCVRQPREERSPRAAGESSARFEKLMSELHKSKFWTTPSPDPNEITCLDGDVTWVEATTGGWYHSAYYTCGRSSKPIAKLAIEAMHIAGVCEEQR